jgi:hypothetical protein
MTLVGAACALCACGACLEPGCECECHEVPGGILPARDVVVPPEELRALRKALAAVTVIHYTPEEHDQPACDADVYAPPGTVMWGTLNPDRVTCPGCLELIRQSDG